MSANDGHSGATSAATFSSPATSGSAAVFSGKKAAKLQRCILSKFSAASPLLLINFFQDFFDLNFYALPFRVFAIFFTLLSLLHYFSLVEQVMLPLWRFVVV